MIQLAFHLSRWFVETAKEGLNANRQTAGVARAEAFGDPGLKAVGQ
jgi:hypothetical protein